MRLIISVVLFLLVSQVQADLVVSEGFIRGLPPGQPNTAAFMTLTNSGDEDITVIAVGSEVADKAEIHTSSEKDGMMHMERLENLMIAAGESVTLKPGGHHLMLLDLYKPLAEGDAVKVRFSLSDGSQYAAVLNVKSVLNENHQHH